MLFWEEKYTIRQLKKVGTKKVEKVVDEYKVVTVPVRKCEMEVLPTRFTKAGIRHSSIINVPKITYEDKIVCVKKVIVEEKPIYRFVDTEVEEINIAYDDVSVMKSNFVSFYMRLFFSHFLSSNLKKTLGQ